MRLDHPEANRLVWAFTFSLAFHLLVWGTWYSGQRFGWWDQLRASRWVQNIHMAPPFLKKLLLVPKPPPQALQKEPPLVFIDVSPAQAAAEPPKDAKYYSSKNSIAANPKADIQTDVPKIEGKQIQVPKTMDVPKQQFVPLQPAAPPRAQQAAKAQEEQKARPAVTPGDIAISKPEPNPKPDTGEQAHSRPRTLKEAMARKIESQVPGEKMFQEGGVKRHLELSSVDAKATPFGAYDAAMIEAISQRWFSLLEDRSYASDSRGKVVLQFVLHQDGRISDMTVAENSSGEVLSLICQKAVLDPAPFAPWPAEMRRILGRTRSIQFTFYYN